MPAGPKHFLLQNVLKGSGAHPASYSMVTAVLTVAKLLGHEVNHSPPSTAEVKNEWSYTSTPPICLHDVKREQTTLLNLAPSHVGMWGVEV
jgi:hypothetical protein